MDLQRQPGHTTRGRPRPRRPTRSDGPPVLRKSLGTTPTSSLPHPCLASELRELRRCSRDARGEADGLARLSLRVSDLARSVGHPAGSTLDVLANREHSSRLREPRGSGRWREFLLPPNQAPRPREPCWRDASWRRVVTRTCSRRRQYQCESAILLHPTRPFRRGRSEVKEPSPHSQVATARCVLLLRRVRENPTRWSARGVCLSPWGRIATRIGRDPVRPAPLPGPAA